MNLEKYDQVLSDIKKYVNEHIFDSNKTLNEMYQKLEDYMNFIGEVHLSKNVREYAYNIFVERVQYENTIFKLKKVL